MACFLCKGTLEDRQTTFMVDIGNSIIIVKNVPSQVCTQCGETTYTDGVAAELERIVNEARETITEVTIVSYTSRVA